MIPSSKYAVDYTDGRGLKWTKQISQIYPSIGLIDNSISISKYDNDIVKTIYRKSTTFNALYDNAITFGTTGDGSNVCKYFSRNDYPFDSVNISTVIVNNQNVDGWSYSTGINEDERNPLNRGIGGLRLLVDADYNKILFNVNVREMTLNTNTNVIQKDLYDDPTYTDIQLKDVDPDRWYTLFYHSNAKVWNGSSWVDDYIAPALLCDGDTVQGFQGGGSCFNTLFNNYSSAPLGTGQNIDFFNAGSNYYWSAENFVNKMNYNNYTLGWSDTYDYKPSFADNFDDIKTTIKNWLVSNSIAPYNNVKFQATREIHTISNDMAVLLTVFITAGLDSNNEMYISNIWNYTFPLIKGSSISSFIAGYGCYYLADANADLTGITPDTLGDCDDIWLGEMNADGMTTGNWIKGASIHSYSGYNKDGNIINENFNPSGGGSDTDGDGEIDMPLYYNSTNTGFVSYYEFTAENIIKAHSGVNELNMNALTLKDVLKNLISYKMFAIAPNKLIKTKTPVIFHLAGRDIEYNGNTIPCNYIESLNTIGLGSIKVPTTFNDYRDFAPYTKLELYVPFCGWTSIPSWCMGKTISGTLFVELMTGSCKAVIKASQTVICELGGCCAYDVPFAAENVGAKTAAIIDKVATTAGAVASGNPIAIAQTGLSLVSTLNANYTEMRGVCGDGSQINGLNQMYLKVTRISYTDTKERPNAYKHQYGIPCAKELTLTKGDGYTQILDANITGNMTAREKQMIIDGFRHGLNL